MPASGEHLSQERLSGKAMEVLEELKDLLGAIEFKPERKNLYRCDNQPALFDIVQRLTKELQFITVKVRRIFLVSRLLLTKVGSNSRI
jgi:hypothetical protein